MIVADTCSETCYFGNQTRERACDDPAPSPGGAQCLQTDGVTLALTETDDSIPCFLEPCPSKEKAFLPS